MFNSFYYRGRYLFNVNIFTKEKKQHLIYVADVYQNHDQHEELYNVDLYFEGFCEYNLWEQQVVLILI